MFLYSAAEFLEVFAQVPALPPLITPIILGSGCLRANSAWVGVETPLYPPPAALHQPDEQRLIWVETKGDENGPQVTTTPLGT